MHFGVAFSAQTFVLHQSGGTYTSLAGDFANRFHGVCAVVRIWVRVQPVTVLHGPGSPWVAVVARATRSSLWPDHMRVWLWRAHIQHCEFDDGQSG